MKIIGLVGSHRRLGNTEILVKQALLGAKSENAEVALLRLTDLSVAPCRGCMACVFKDQPCDQQDDMRFFLETLESADAVILGAPTYFLGPAAIVKRILDRFLMVPPQTLEGKQAATIAVAGRPGWIGLASPLLNLFPLAAGYTIVDHITAYSPGPGEVCLDETNLVRAHNLGANLARSRAAQPKIHQDLANTTCPVCWSTAFQPLPDGLIECPVCRTRAKVRGCEVEFDEESIATHRLTLRERQDHLRDWIQASKTVFQRNLRDVLRARKPFIDTGINWISPRAGVLANAREENP